MDSKFFNRLRAYPTVLFLGQNYLSLTNGKNLLMDQIHRKFQTDKQGYESLLELHKHAPESLTWINSLCQKITAPEWLQKVARFPWSHIYTSSVDEIWTDSFNMDNWRSVQYIYSDKRYPENLRDKSNLHATFLYGSLSAEDKSDKPPTDHKEMRIRKRFVESALIERLPEILTPLGTLLIEGYDGNQDWYQYEDLCTLMDLLGEGQVHLFSANEQMVLNHELQEYVQAGKLTLHCESLHSMFQQAEESGLINFSYAVEQGTGKTVTLAKNVISIPPHIWNRINKWAHVLDDLTLVKTRQAKTSDKLRFNDFRKFLFDSGAVPNWEGYVQGFAFKRDCEDILYKKIKTRIHGNLDEPLILHGQTGTGKTVVLGSLAMRFREEGEVPVIFIERSNRMIDYNDVDAFLECLEDQGSTTCLILFDGMLNRDTYTDFISFLKGRGRKRIVLVGTSYKNKNNWDDDETYFLMPNMISSLSNESMRFEEFLKQNAGLELPREVIEGNNFLVMLYRYLPTVKRKLQSGIQRESEYTLETIRKNIKDLVYEPLNTLQEAFLDAKRKNPEATLDPYSISERSERLAGEEISKLDKMLMLIMVPAQFGNKIPIELLSRTLNVGYISNLYEILDRYDLFRTVEDNRGNYFVDARHAVEAEAICQLRERGGIAAQVDVISQLIQHVTDKGEFEGEEINFIVDLMVKITENEHNLGHPFNFRQHYKKFAEAFTFLRENGVRRPNLIVQECSLYRKFYSLDKSKTADIGDFETYFEKVEGIIQKGLEDSKGRTKSHLFVEFASCLRERLERALGNKEHPKMAESLLNRISQVVAEAQRMSKRNFHAVDTLILATVAIYRRSEDEDVRLEAKAEFYRIVGVTDPEELDAEQVERYNERMLEYAEILNDTQLSDQAFDRLKANGSKAGYIIRAFIPNLPTDRELTAEEIGKCRTSYEYLENFKEKVLGDEKCLFMKLKYWWLSKTGRPIFYKERQLPPFTREDWNMLYEMLQSIKIQSEESNLKSLVLYLLGVTEFNLGYYSDSLKTFNELDSNPEYDRKRMSKTFIATDMTLISQRPIAQTFQGIVSKQVHGTRGSMYVSKLNTSVPFMNSDFAKHGLNEYDTVPINIAFNYRGWIAVPPEYIKDIPRGR